MIIGWFDYMLAKENLLERASVEIIDKQKTWTVEFAPLS